MQSPAQRAKARILLLLDTVATVKTPYFIQKTLFAYNCMHMQTLVTFLFFTHLFIVFRVSKVSRVISRGSVVFFTGLPVGFAVHVPFFSSQKRCPKNNPR